MFKQVSIDRPDRWKKIIPNPDRIIDHSDRKEKERLSLQERMKDFLRRGGKIKKLPEVVVDPEISMKKKCKGPGTDNWLILRNNGSGLARKDVEHS